MKPTEEHPSNKQIIESLLLASSGPLRFKKIQEVVGVGAREIKGVIDELNREYEDGSRSFRVMELAGGYQLYTLPQCAPWVESLFSRSSRLSQPALETLAIVAYEQPVSRPRIEAIRGVSVDGVLHTLMSRNLVRIVGRAESVGRPLLYGTTGEFLRYFGLRSLTDLPRRDELEALLHRRERGGDDGHRGDAAE